MLSILSAKQTQKMAVFLMSKAIDFIMLSAFTFDLLVIVTALIEAAQRGVHVQVFVDQGHSMKGTTAEQMNRLENLRSHGVEVFLSQGVSSGGIQQSKTLFCRCLFFGRVHKLDTLFEKQPRDFNSDGAL